MHHHPRPRYDDHWEGQELAADDTHRFVWLWYGFNIRLLAVPHGIHGMTAWDYGWCYPRDPELVAAAVAGWNADVQDEPLGWHKRPCMPVRRAPRRDEDPHYNRPRCLHGCYADEGCRTINCDDGLPWTGRPHDLTERPR
jgi:hypothetical protein